MRKSRTARNLSIAILIVVVLVFAAALIVPHFVDINRYHDQIQAQLEKRLGRSVSLGAMKLSLLPPSFEVENAVIGEDKSLNTSQPFATTEKLSISVKLWPLLHKEVDIKSLEMQSPHIELVRDPQGVWNFSTLGPAAKPNPSGRPQDLGQLALANLDIRDGQIAVTDYQKHQPRAVYDRIDLTVRNFAPDQQFSVKVAALLPGSGKQSISLEGRAGPLQQADFANTNFDGTLHLSEVSISGLETFLSLPALSGMEASLSGDAKIVNSGGKLTASGNIRMDNPRVHNVDIGYPITMDYDFADDLRNDVIEIHRGDLKLGTTPVSLAGTINTKPTPAQIDLKIKASDATIDQMARLASAFGVAFGKGMDVNGRLNADIQARGAAGAPAMNGHLSIHDLVINGKELQQPVKAGDVELTLAPDTIRSNDFTATTGTTSVTVNLVLAQYTGPNSAISASLQMPNARINEVLNIAKAYGVAAAEGMSGDGMLQLDVRVQGPTKDMSALSFNGTGKIQNATLKTPEFTQPVKVRNADIVFSQNSATLKNLAATVGQTNTTGSMTLKNFAAPQVQFALNADKINVAELQQIFSTAPVKRASADHNFWDVIPSANAQTGAPSSATSKMTGGGTITVGTVLYDDLTITNAHSTVALDHGLIQLNPTTATLYGGSESGNVTIDMRPAQPVYTVNMKTDKVDANRLLSSVSSLKKTLYGMLASNVDATFSSTSADSIARSLNGSLSLNLTNGRMMGLDLLNELAAVGQFIGHGQRGAQGFTDLVQLTGNFDVKNGVAQTTNLKAVISGGTFAAIGSVDLASQSLDMHVTAVLNKTMSQQVGSTQVGGYMNTALANSQGELVLPVIVTGTFQHPQVVPDVKQIAQMKLQNLLPTSKNPGALTSGIVGAFLGQDQSGNGKQKGGVSGFIDALGGKQQPGGQSATNPQSDGSKGQQPQSSPLGDLFKQMLDKKNKQQQQKKPPQ